MPRTNLPCVLMAWASPATWGCEPASLTGYVPLAANRQAFEQVWKAPIPILSGLNQLEMLDAAQAGEFKGLWAIGYDILLTNANVHATRNSLRQLECVVVQDLFLNETAKEFGTIFLPAASTFEKEGTFMNAERRIQRVRQALSPVGNSKTDWEIIQLVAKALGVEQGFQFDSPQAIWNEIRQVWKAVAGISYERLEEQGIQWPCTGEYQPGTEFLHATSFPKGPRASLQRIAYRPTVETVTAEFPFLLITGRTLYHFNAGTMTQRLSIAAGTAVCVRSRYGEATLVARPNSAVKPGELFTTFHNPALFVNQVTSPQRDSRVSSPEYKVTAVQVKVANR